MTTDKKTPPLPPWRQYPKSEAYWGGWRQGASEDWLINTWLPFWQGLSAEARLVYLAENPPPDEDWKNQLLLFWSQP